MAPTPYSRWKNIFRHPSREVGSAPTEAVNSIYARYERFSTCDACGRVFWEGSHWQRMRTLLDGLLAARATA